LVLAAAGALFASAAQANKPDITKLAPRAITVEAARISSFNRAGGGGDRFGKLIFRGGLVLTAPGAPNFGGWSGLAVDDDGRDFVAVSDSGVWLTGTIAYDGDAPQRVVDARLGPLLALDGKPLRRPRDRDAEAVAILSGSLTTGTLLVAFEQNARIARYDVALGRLSASRGFLQKPPAMRKFRGNTGLEAMTVMRGGPFKGATIGMAERYLDRKRNHTGWIWTPSGAQAFQLTNIGDYDVTDLATLDDGTLFVLERRFRWLEGVKLRIRRVGVSELALGGTATGETLIEADLEHQIDNMEGLAATRTKSGDVLLTLISDDNFNSYLQRTLLLQFALPGPQTVKARPAE
jgi:hypothetical protein